MEALSIAALAVAVVALAVAVVAIRPSRTPQAQAAAEPSKEPAKAPARADIARLRDEVKALRIDLADALRHLAVVRYDAFGTMGGHMSWSMALLDDNGNGVVLTSINGRNESRSYAKNVREFASDAKLSPEEEEAIELLRKEAS
jgi:hypothetical protein